MIKRKFLLTQLFILYGSAVFAQEQTHHGIILNESIEAYFQNDGSPVILVAMNDVSKHLDVLKTLPRIRTIIDPMFRKLTRHEARQLKMAGGVHTIDTVSVAADTLDVFITYKRYLVYRRGKTFLNHHYYANENIVAPCGNYAGKSMIIDNGPRLFRRYYYDKTTGTWIYSTQKR